MKTSSFSRLICSQNRNNPRIGVIDVEASHCLSLLVCNARRKIHLQSLSIGLPPESPTCSHGRILHHCRARMLRTAASAANQSKVERESSSPCIPDHPRAATSHQGHHTVRGRMVVGWEQKGCGFLAQTHCFRAERAARRLGSEFSLWLWRFCGSPSVALQACDGAEKEETNRQRQRQTEREESGQTAVRKKND
jgi:hypothetical protein